MNGQLPYESALTGENRPLECLRHRPKLNTSQHLVDSTRRKRFNRVFRILTVVRKRRFKIGCLVAAFLALTGFFLIGLPILLFAGLVINGFVRAGNWEDDPKNWERAFGSPMPKEVQVVHSTYWRSPHFTLEQGFAFQLHAPPSFATEWAGHYKMRDSRPDDDGRVQRLKAGFPKWFLPKPPSAYRGWLPVDDPYSKFALFIDKETGDLFCTDGQ